MFSPESSTQKFKGSLFNAQNINKGIRYFMRLKVGVFIILSQTINPLRGSENFEKEKVLYNY